AAVAMPGEMVGDCVVTLFEEHSHRLRRQFRAAGQDFAQGRFAQAGQMHDYCLGQAVITGQGQAEAAIL
ncbi:hypothetical protein SMA90_32125, partial [Escherichia coli]